MDGFKDYLKKTNQYNNARMIDKTAVGDFLNIWENENLRKTRPDGLHRRQCNY